MIRVSSPLAKITNLIKFGNKELRLVILLIAQTAAANRSLTGITSTRRITVTAADLKAVIPATGLKMKSLLYATTTMTLLVAGPLSPAVADGLKSLDSNTRSGGSLISDTTSRTATTPFPVARQTGNNTLQLHELDPELQRLYDEIMGRPGASGS